MDKIKQFNREFYQFNSYRYCLNKINNLPEEEIDESNKNKFYEAIKRLKNHENEVRVLRQDLEIQLRLYKNEAYLKKLLETKNHSHK